MYSHKTKTEKKAIAPRFSTTLDHYVQQVDVLIADLNKRGWAITELQQSPFPATGGIRWTATVTTGKVPDGSTAYGQAMRLVGLTFQGVYQPTPWERRDLKDKPIEVSWFTNGHKL